MACTVQQLIEKAGKKIGLVNMTPEELEDGLLTLNQMLAHLSASKVIAGSPIHESFTLASGTESYSVGSGGDIDTQWPSRIVAVCISLNSFDYPVRRFSSDEYAYTGNKDESGRPVALYYERKFPLGEFIFWPVPDQNYTVKLWSNKVIASYDVTQYTTDVALPPEYELMLVYNLAVEMAPEYGVDVSQAVLLRAKTTMDNIRRVNSVPIPQLNTNVIGGVGGRSSDWLWKQQNISDDVFPFSFPFTLR
jgi:hypothetical protein